MEENVTLAYELPRLGIRVFHRPPGKQSPSPVSELTYYSHKHPYYELHIIEEGDLTFQAGARLLQLRAGQFCLIGPDVVHAPKSDISAVRRSCMNFELLRQPSPVGDFIAEALRQSGSCTGSARKLLPILTQLWEEDLRTPFSGEMIHQLLGQLILRMAQAMEQMPTPTAAAPGDLNQLRTVHIDNFLNNSFHLAAGEEALAKELGISRRQLDRVFKKIYGKSYREKLLEVRKEAACDLLKGDLSIARIAERIGYGSSSNFTAFFKSAMGMTPSQYRRLWKQKL